MSQVGHPSHDCTQCGACLDYIAWLEGELLRTIEFYNGVSGVMTAHANVAERVACMAALFNQSRDVVHARRLHQIERHLTEGEDEQR